MSNNKAQIANNKTAVYDLGERTAKFGEAVIDFVRTIKKEDVNRILMNQVVRSATSIGANYMEADGAESKKDFIHKIALCKKEAKETRYWFRMIIKANPLETKRCQILWKEAHELSLIFSVIFRSGKTKE